MSARCGKPVDVLGLAEYIGYVQGDDEVPPTFSETKLKDAIDFVESIFPSRWYEVIPDPDYMDDDDIFDYDTFFAISKGMVVGFVAFKTGIYNKDVLKEVKRLGIAPGNAYNVYLLGVEEKWRRSGVAETLLARSIPTFCGRYCFFEVYARERNAPAISFYKKMGFKEMARVEKYYSNTGEDAIVFGLAT